MSTWRGYLCVAVKEGATRMGALFPDSGSWVWSKHSIYQSEVALLLGRLDQLNPASLDAKGKVVVLTSGGNVGWIFTHEIQVVPTNASLR